MKKVILIILICVILFAGLLILTGCSNNSAEDSTTNQRATSNNENSNNSTNNQSITVNYEKAAEAQMSKPQNGDTIAIIKVKDFGEIKVKFFADVAPKAVENFTTHAKEGYYNGLTFHRVINEFMIQGGDPKGDGTGGESIWGEGFGTELSPELVPYRGSLCMAMSSLPNSIGSQFFITQANYSETMANYLNQAGYPSELIEQYKIYGGYLSLYMQYTVFGQVFEGMDVVDAIAKVETETTASGQEDKPVQDVVIETIEVTTYQEK